MWAGVEKRKRMTGIRVWIVVVMSGVGALGLLAQSPDSRGRRFQGGMMNRFEESAPQVGDKLPDVELFDAQGQPLRLSSLKGSYTVLVLGCLT